MSLIQCKPNKGGNTAQLVRYPYCRTRKRNITVTYGSIRLDADPDDVKGFIQVSERYCNVPFDSLFSGDDLVVIRAWLLQHGDRRAAERRRARDARIERKILEQIRSDSNEGDDALTKAAEALLTAGELLYKLAENCKAIGQDPWTVLRGRYLSVRNSYKGFEQGAKNAGLTKEKRKEVG